MNKVIIIGNVGTIKDGEKALKLSVATTESWKDKTGEKKSATEWHNVTVFGPSAKALATFIKKGQKVAVEGRIQTSSYEKDGQKMYSTSIIASNVQVLSPKDDTGDFSA